MGSLILLFIAAVLISLLLAFTVAIIVSHRQDLFWYRNGGTRELQCITYEYKCDQTHVQNCFPECPHYKKCKRYNKLCKFTMCMAVPFAIILTIILFPQVIKFRSIDLQGDIEAYTATKTNIEESINNDKLSGFERFELVKQATLKVEWLAKKQANMKKWTAFDYSKEVKETLLKLEHINLSGNNP